MHAGYWSVDAKAETAMGGVWKKGPGAGLFKSLNDVSAVAWQAPLQSLYVCTLETWNQSLRNVL